MFDKIFLQVLNMSFMASFVILFVIIIRLLLKKVPKIFSYALWAVVAFRLICPFSFESVISLMPINANPVPQDIIHESTPQINSGIQIIDRAVNNSMPPYDPGNSAGNGIEITLFLYGLIWIAGILALLIYSIYTMYSLRGKIRNSSCKNTLNNIFEIEGITPFVFGFFKPKIYLPTGLSQSEYAYILLHEQTHIKRLDHIIKPLSFAILCLHWFNPLVWIAFILMSKDMELSCDESVIKKLGSDIKADYSTSLLSLSTGKKFVNGCPISFGENDTKGRIKNILSYKKPAFWVSLAAVILIITVSVGFLSNPKQEDDDKIKWAKNLKVTDVSSIELMIPSESEEDKRYKNFAEEEFAEVIGVINKAKGFPTSKPDTLYGATYTLAVTMQDGVRHEVTNKSNQYLVIDGQYFNGDSTLLHEWNFEGNEKMPSGKFMDTSITYDSNLPANITLESTDVSILPSLYKKNGFDSNYDDLPIILANSSKDNLIISLFDKEITKIRVGEDYYEHQSDVSVTCVKETYELEANAEGKFKLPIEMHGKRVNENAIYYVEAGENLFVFKVIYQLGDKSALENKLIKAAQDSFKYDNREVSITVPTGIPDKYQISIDIHTQLPIGDGLIKTIEPFREVNDTNSWEQGKTYTARLFEEEPPEGTYIALSVALVNKEDNIQEYWSYKRIDAATGNDVSPIANPSVDITAKFVAANQEVKIAFTDEQNRTLRLELTAPKNWVFKKPAEGGASAGSPSIDVYDGDTLISNIWYNTFEYVEGIPYMSVYNSIMLGSMASWDNEYIEINKTDMTCTATVRPWHKSTENTEGKSNAEIPEVYNKGVLSYDANQLKYVAIWLDDTVSNEAWQMIAKTVKLF